MKPFNLIDSHFQKSNLFQHLPIFDDIYYHGHPEGNVHLYKASREGQSCSIFAITIIREEEKIIWEAAEDLLQRCVYAAVAQVRGVFTFDLLTFDIYKELNTFKYDEFGMLIRNHSLKTRPGEERLVKYSSAYGLLKKIGEAHWGKITMKTSVEVYKDKSTFLYILVNRLFKLAPFSHDPLILLINDLSQQSIFDPQNKDQQELLAKTVEEKVKQSIEFLPEVYIQDKNGVRELMSGTVLNENI